MNVGKNILDIRKSNDLSQEQFGQLFHLTRQTVSNWEKEKSFPDLRTLIDISNRFDVSLDLLIKEDAHLVRVRRSILWTVSWKRSIRLTEGIMYRYPL